MSNPAQDSSSVDSTQPKTRRRFRFSAIKTVFAMEYVLQGLANPFQGITYQPFFRHFRFDYGLSEAATQNLFSKSYLAWSFKPLIGFLIDAYGKTRTLLTLLLSAVTLGYLLVPLVDKGYLVFFAFMFGLSVVMAATDVSVDRATVIEGDEEAKATGKSKSATVGLNQAICWAAIYGTGILAAVLGGWVAENLQFNLFMRLLSIMPFLTLLVVLLLPKDKAVPIPVTRSVKNFWVGLNSGPILWIMLFYFIFHFQPALGALWTNHLIENLHFSQTQIGLADGAANFGYFLGVILFAWMGIKWQDRMGLRKLFKIYILLSVAVNLTQYLLVDPWFSRVTGGLHALMPGVPLENVRLGWLATYNFLLSIAASIIRMSTFSLVGAVIPVAAAGSLFAGFMSVANLAYSFCYASGAWLYTHGMDFGFLRGIQDTVFGISGKPGDELSISMLILIGSLAYLLSFIATRMLPDRRQTIQGVDEEEAHEGPDRWLALPAGLKKSVDRAALALGAFLFLFFTWHFFAGLGWFQRLQESLDLWAQPGFGAGFDPVSALLICFFGVTFLRKILLDRLLKRQQA
jgi:MFS family permease